MAWHQLTEWTTPWPGDPDLRVCFGRDDEGRVMVVQNRQGSETYSHQILTAILVAEAPLPMVPAADALPPAKGPGDNHHKPARTFWNLSTPAPAAIPDETPPPAAWTAAPTESEGVVARGTPSGERPLPGAAAAGGMEAGPLTMFYAENPFAGQEPKRRSRRVARWSVRIVGLLVLVVLVYLILTGA